MGPVLASDPLERPSGRLTLASSSGAQAQAQWPQSPRFQHTFHQRGARLPARRTSAKNGRHHLLEWNIQSCCHVLKVTLAVPCASPWAGCTLTQLHMLLFPRVLPESPLFPNEPFLLSAAPLGLKSQAILLIPQALPWLGFLQPPCS